MGRGGSGVRICAGFGLWLGLAGAAMAADCALDQVELRSPSGNVQRFSVEVADDSAEQAQGLMFREAMPKSSGMLFVFPAPKHATFWMRNTLIPLDMIFADQSGMVTRVHENAVPKDETRIDGGPGVVYVLEINGGLARRMGIVPGSVLRHPLIANAVAAWPCAAP